MKDKNHSNHSNQDKPASEFKEHLISLNRVSLATSGGRTFSFQAVTVVGNGKGTVGLGIGKAQEVQEAIRKANACAMKKKVKLNLKKNKHGQFELFHEANEFYGASQVLARPAPDGTAVQAGGPVRIVFEAAGITNVRAKSLGSKHKFNVAKATMKILVQQDSIEEVKALRLGDNNE